MGETNILNVVRPELRSNLQFGSPQDSTVMFQDTDSAGDVENLVAGGSGGEPTFSTITYTACCCIAQGLSVKVGAPTVGGDRLALTVTAEFIISWEPISGPVSEDETQCKVEWWEFTETGTEAKQEDGLPKIGYRQWTEGFNSRSAEGESPGTSWADIFARDSAEFECPSDNNVIDMVDPVSGQPLDFFLIQHIRLRSGCPDSGDKEVTVLLVGAGDGTLVSDPPAGVNSTEYNALAFMGSDLPPSGWPDRWVPPDYWKRTKTGVWTHGSRFAAR